MGEMHGGGVGRRGSWMGLEVSLVIYDINYFIKLNLIIILYCIYETRD
jgi:hypothetical protein